MKSSSKPNQGIAISGASLFPKLSFSQQQQQPTIHSISRLQNSPRELYSNYGNRQQQYQELPQTGNVFGFGIQVTRIPTQLRERAPKPAAPYSLQEYRRKVTIPKLPPSASKPQRGDFMDFLEQGLQEIKEERSTKFYKLPKLNPVPKTQESIKPKAQSQNDITSRSRRDSKVKLDKLSSNKKLSDEKNGESFTSIYGILIDGKKPADGTKLKEINEIEDLDNTMNDTNPIEVKGLTIIQKKLTQVRDNWNEYQLPRNHRRESAGGPYLNKALNEVNTNINIRTQLEVRMESPKGEGAMDSYKVKLSDRRGKTRKDSATSRDKAQNKLTQRLATGETPTETKKISYRPDSKAVKGSKKREKPETPPKQQDDSKIEEYRFDAASDDDLSLDEYLKAKKENQENNDTEEFEYNYNVEA